MEKKSSQIQSHNLSHQEMKELQHAQINGEVENDASGSEDSAYKFPEHEKHLVHAEIEIPEYDQVTGKKKSIAKVQKYTPREFRDQETNNGFAGYTVNILHDPSKNGKVLDGINRVTAGGQSLGDLHHPSTKEALLNKDNGVNGAAAGGVTVTKDNQVIGGANESEALKIKVKSMNKADLTAKYKELYGEDVPADVVTNQDIKDKLFEKIDFLATEKNSGAADETEQNEEV